MKKKISVSLILIFIIYVIVSSFLGAMNVSYAGQYISAEEADKLCPGIKILTNNLKQVHSNYNFQFFDTGIDWNEAILREYQGHGKSPTSLFNISDRATGMWVCPICGDKRYDNGSLCCASMESLKYMMDPRNSVTEESVFQFKSLETPDAGYNEIAAVVGGTFLNDAECINAIVEASNAYKVNAFYLVAKMITEHGRDGSTLSRGVVKDGVTYYNFFNINASGNSVSAIITNGTNYAASHGWNSKRMSILGGAQIVRQSYIGRGQNTCYYQKFNVVNTESGLFNHQYAQNILAAENEGRKFKGYYTQNGQIVGNHTFIIPLYKNMPANAEGRPKTAKANSIGYETAVVTANGGLKVRSRPDVNSPQIGAISQSTNVKVLMRTTIQSGGFFWDLVIADESGVCGYVARNYIRKTGEGNKTGPASATEYSPDPAPIVPINPPSEPEPEPEKPIEPEGEKIKLEETNIQVSAKTTAEELKEKYPDVVIKDNSGNVTTNFGTGYKAIIDGKEYVLVKKGDVNGDGNSNIVDVVLMLNHIKESQFITDEAKLEAAKTSCGEGVTVIDVVTLLNLIKEKVTDIKIK